ncbi:MAG: hypothetical protein ACFB2Z_11730 [Maricaulaceae bacterium]
MPTFYRWLVVTPIALLITGFLALTMIVLIQSSQFEAPAPTLRATLSPKLGPNPDRQVRPDPEKRLTEVALLETVVSPPPRLPAPSRAAAPPPPTATPVTFRAFFDRNESRGDSHGL